MNPNQIAQSIQLTVAGTALSSDGSAVVVTYNPPPPVNFTQAQLTAQLSQLQTQAASLTANLAKNAAAQANIQAQSALFPVVAVPKVA